MSCIGCGKGGPEGMISMGRVDSIRKKYRRGEPVAAIARELGVSRDTVYKYARMEDLSPEPPKARKRRPSMNTAVRAICQVYPIWVTTV